MVTGFFHVRLNISKLLITNITTFPGAGTKRGHVTNLSTTSGVALKHNQSRIMTSDIGHRKTDEGRKKVTVEKSIISAAIAS